MVELVGTMATTISAADIHTRAFFRYQVLSGFRLYKYGVQQPFQHIQYKIWLAIHFSSNSIKFCILFWAIRVSHLRFECPTPFIVQKPQWLFHVFLQP